MKNLFILIVLLSSFYSEAQNLGRISGKVIDGNKKTIEAATISLLKAKDSSVIKYSVADRNGQYAFEELPFGSFMVSVTSVGHSKAISEVVSITSDKPVIEMKTIELIPSNNTLKEVSVTARRPFIEQKADKMVVNVDASVTNVGATALEVLEKSPGITIDKDGNISLKGKQGVTIMMDGRPAYLSGTDLTNYLKGLPASAIDQIEIMTNPSSKYDAAGNSGIINIKSKKNRQTGFNGNFTTGYGQGAYWKSNNSFNLNYRNGKFNFFANGSVNKGNNYQELNIQRRFKDSATGNITNTFQQTTHMRYQNTFSNLKIGADYFPDKKNTLGIVISGFYNPETFSSTSTSFLENSNSKVDSIVYAVSNNKNSWKNGGVNFNYRHQFDSTGRELTADLDYVTYKTGGNQNFNNYTLDPSWNLLHDELLRSNIPVNVDIYSAKLDYSLPLKDGGKFETGIKSSYVKTNNSADYFNVLNNEETVDYSKTNNFIYHENINAAYLNYNRQYKKFGVQLGLRYEYTSYNGSEFGNPTRKDSSFNTGYGNLFPTAYLSFNANKDNQLALSYGRRIDRPAYQDLNPFLFFLDKYTYQQGNPYVKPQFTNNFEFSHTYKNFLTTTLNFSHTYDFMSETFTQATDKNGKQTFASIVSRGNIGYRNEAGASMSAQLHVTKWWMAMLYGNFGYSHFKGAINQGREQIDVSAGTFLVNVNNQFNFNKGWAAELSGFYRTKGIEGQIVIQSLGQASAGLSKQVLKTKGSLKLSIRDIFLTNHAVGDINFGNTLAHFENKRDSRVVNLAFTYRFGKPIKGIQQRRKIGGADEEQNRVKVGNGN